MKTEKAEIHTMNAPQPERPKPENPKDEKSKPGNRTAQNSQSRDSNMPAIAGLAIAVVLLVVGLWLAHELRSASKLQDCVMSGRTNCNVMQP
jgi:hypothetical protein